MSDLPTGWEWSTIGEVTVPVEQHDPRKSPDLAIEYIDIGGVDGDRLRIESTKKYPGAEAPSRARQIVRSGDTVLSTVRVNLTKTAFVPPSLDGATASTGFSVLRPCAAVIPEFLFHYVTQDPFVKSLAKQQTGSSYPAVRDRDVRAMSIAVPPLAEQRRIVAAIEEHFSRLDAAEAGLRRSRHRCSLQLESVINSELAGSATAPLVDFCEPGGITDGPFGSNLKSSHYVNAGPRVVRLGNLGRRVFIDEQTHIRQDHFDRLKQHQVRARDLLVASLYSDHLRACVAPDDLGPAIVKADCIRLRPAEGNSAEFLAFVLCRSAVDAWCQNKLSGVGRQRLGLSSIRELPVPKLDTQSQATFLKRVGAAARAIERVEKEIHRTLRQSAALRHAILAAAFSGHLVTQDPDDEPASVLLERVAAGRSTPKPTRSKKAAP